MWQSQSDVGSRVRKKKGNPRNLCLDQHRPLLLQVPEPREKEIEKKNEANSRFQQHFAWHEFHKHTCGQHCIYWKSDQSETVLKWFACFFRGNDFHSYCESCCSDKLIDLDKT